MRSRVTLLIEIGCEEIPARMLPGAADGLGHVLVSILESASLSAGTLSLYWTPRRFAVRIEDVEAEVPARRETITGPPARAAWSPDGTPTRAAEGFAKKNGVRPEDLVRVQRNEAEYAAVEVVRPAWPLAEILRETFEGAVAAMTFPKTMRWGDGRHRFVRPVHWLVALADDEILPLSLYGVKAGRRTVGHRTIAPGEHPVADAESWVETLEKAGVVVDPRERRRRLLENLEGEAERELGGKLVSDAALLEEVADIVEYPGALVGSYEKDFVEELPREVLEVCLRHHQKAFAVMDAEGRLLPGFAVAVNVRSDPRGDICRGNRWVISGRLEDARFFWREDRKRSLADRVKELDGVTFQRDLGSFGAKTRRLVRLVAALADEMQWDSSRIALLERAAELSRADLVTGLVGEFPELQGTAGALLARADGENPSICEALAAFYLPGGADGPLPESEEGRLLALADRIDTLTGCLAVGMVPKGSKDPFALRRAGFGAVRLAASFADLDLHRAMDLAAGGFDGADGGPDLGASTVQDDLSEFLFERLAYIALHQENNRYDEIRSVKPLLERCFVPSDLFARLRALRSFRSSNDFAALTAASKRVRNILAQAIEKGETVDRHAATDRLTLDAETALLEALEAGGPVVQKALDERSFEKALQTISDFRPVIDRFFDDSMVMVEDRGLRAQRLGLLARFSHLVHDIADISEIVLHGTA